MRDILQTDRLILRPFKKSDWKALVTHADDMDVARATGQLPHPYTEVDAKNWISFVQTKPSSLIVYAIATKEDNLIGCISLSRSGTELELGYWLGKQFWYQGYMREAVSALLAEARTTYAPIQLSASVFVDNPRSFALLAAFGFKNPEYISSYCVARGHPVACHRLSLELQREMIDA